MRVDRQREHGLGAWRQLSYAVALLCVLLAGCKHTPGAAKQNSIQTPEAIYREVERQFMSGDLIEARRLAKDEFEALSRAAVRDPLWTATFRYELAKVLLYQGESPEVVPLLRSAPAPKQGDLAVRQNLLLAIAEARLGHAAPARQALAAAEAFNPQGVLHAEFVGAQGSVALYQGRLEEARDRFQAALGEAQQDHATFLEMQMWTNLGSVASETEHYEEAVGFLHHASEMGQAAGARLTLEKALNNLVLVYLSTGDFVRALQSATAAEAQARALGLTLDEAQLLLHAGTCQLQTNDLAGARSSFEQSLALAEKLQNPEKLLNAHIALAYLLLRQQPDAAEPHIREAVRIAQIGEDPTEQLQPALLQSFLLIKQGQNTPAERKLLQLDKDSRSYPSIQWEAENTLATLYANAGRRQDADRWFQRAIATFHHQRLTLKSVELQLPFLENGSDLYLGYMEHLIRTQRTDEALQVLDQSRAETLAEGLGTAGRGAAPIAEPRMLATRLHATILIYCLRPRASFLWAIGPKQEQFYTLAGSEAILPLVARHTQAILGSKDLLAQQDATARPLYDLLVRPAEALLQPGGRVVLIADKDLGSLNFETLVPAPQPGTPPHYWIEDVALTNARSLRLLAASHEAASPVTAQLLLLGDPIYRPQDYPALPNAAAELARVAGHFTPERRAIFAGAQATPAAYTTASPGRFAYIHFVAHATASEVNPLDSAIILSGAPGPYKLYARDLLGQPLRADLVTLSSCFGSGTRNYSGEGVVGLVWAFLRAGAHSVIGAMWEVSDLSTPQLMDTLYAQLLTGSSPDQALRSAKLAMLHGGDIYRKPLYWASFQLYTGR